MDIRFDRFTKRAMLALSAARVEAVTLNHPHIGTEHLLLGLLTEEMGIAARVLASMGITLPAARQVVDVMVPADTPTDDINLTPRAERVIALSFQAAEDFQHHYVGTEHILLGILRAESGRAIDVMRRFDVDHLAVTQRTLQALKGPKVYVRDTREQTWEDIPMTRQIIETDSAPAAVGPYSQAVTVGNLVYTAGQVGIDPETGDLRLGTKAQTEQAMKNLRAVLEAAGSGLAHIVKTTIFMADMGDYQQINEVYSGFFEDAPPARSAVEVARLPLDARVEIEVVAAIPE